MGLDSVELVLAIEDKFNIHISDAEACNAETVGDLYPIVLANVESGQPGQAERCLTSAAFYRTRRGFVDALRLNRREVRPSTPLESLFPKAARRRLWRDLQGKTELAIPNLRHAVWIETSLLVTGVLVALVAICFTTLGGNTLWMVPSLALPGLYAGTFCRRSR